MVKHLTLLALEEKKWLQTSELLSTTTYLPLVCVQHMGFKSLTESCLNAQNPKLGKSPSKT